MAREKILSREEAEQLAMRALAYLAEDRERLFRFLDRTGLGPDTIRQAAQSPGFLGAVLDYVAEDEAIMIAFAASLEIRPERVMEARRKLSPPEPGD